MRFKPNRKIFVPGASATSPSASNPVIAHEAGEPKPMESGTGESLRDTEVFENLDQLEEHLETISPSVPAACDPVVIVNAPTPIVSDEPAKASDHSQVDRRFAEQQATIRPAPNPMNEAETGVALLCRNLVKMWLGSPLTRKLAMLMIVASVMSIVVTMLAPGLSLFSFGYAIGHGFGLLLGCKAAIEKAPPQVNWIATGPREETL